VRWVVLTDDPPGVPGGVAAFTSRVTTELARRGHEVTIYGRARPGAVAPDAVRFVPVAGPSFGRWGGEWLGLRAWRDLASADRVLATTWPVATFAAIIRPDLDVVAHGSDVTRPPVRPRSFDRVWSSARAWAMSRFLAERLASRGISSMVLPAPVEPASSPRLSGGGARWAFVGRAIHEKGGDRFVRICAAAGARGIVVGDGPARTAWEALAVRLGADVRFTGALPATGVRDVMASSDLVFLLPRGPEGLGLTLIEGAALGVPAVGCRAGGVPEAVGPGLLIDATADADRSAADILSWNRAGDVAWRWCVATHGVDRTVNVLCGHPASSHAH
jgi:glycosyltransferase involved in cell wall biosynthesis